MATLRICAWALTALLTSKTASAQAGVYALFTGANLDTTQTIAAPGTTSSGPTYTTTTTSTKVFGPTFGFYGDVPTPIVQIGGDIRGYLLNGGGLQHYNGVIGPRVSVHLPVIKFKPYAEFLFGFGNYKTASSDTGTTGHIDYEYVVGVDHKLLSLFDWRILEFSDTNYYNGSVPTKALSTGLVLRIP